MTLDFSNINTLWTSILVETWYQLGLTTAVISPGSRSTPLTVAFAHHKNLSSIPILDERSAAFFALGIAKKSGLPVALVCTSGTAGANYYPAIIEARESRIPLLILTCDRPPELRDCHSGQTVDQVKFYGHYPNWEMDLALPSVDSFMLGYVRQMALYAWEKSLFPVPGSVHLNIPFKDPLAPIVDPQISSILTEEFTQETGEHFFDHCQYFPQVSTPIPPSLHSLFKTWKNQDQGVIIGGVANPLNPLLYSQAIAVLSQFLKWPVLAEGLSPLRNYASLNPYLISTYDCLLRNPNYAQELSPKIVIQIGDLPTSKELRLWLEKTQPQRFIIDPSDHNFDPLHGKTIHVRTTPEIVMDSLQSSPSFLETKNTQKMTDYLQKWCDLETQIREKIDSTFRSIETIIEPKISWLISQILPPETPLFISNSMPVRDVEFFWSPNNRHIRPYFNRGANGIDGILSTALGIAHHNQPSVLLTGDLALLHDTNGFLVSQKLQGHLTIILINNQGGGIFEMLPISQFNPPFEEFFATPQEIDFSLLCQTYKIPYQQIETWEELQEKLNPLPLTGMRVLELKTDRQKDSKWRKKYLGSFANISC